MYKILKSFFTPWRDSNRRSPVSEADAMPLSRTARAAAKKLI
jgi:hypothetical protein